MRLPAPLFALIALVFAGLALAWTKDDYEIFDLVAALKADEGNDASFYSFVGVEPGATTSEINKAFRRRSLELHPDKNRGVHHAQERYARLGVVASILKNGEKRERYNFFYKNGVPTWKGFGYAYTRWRPGMGFVLSFLVLVTAGMQYVVLRLNYARDTKRVEYFTQAAQRLARGAAGRRKVKVPMVEGAYGGDTLELVVDGDQVLLPHEDGTVTPLDSLAPQPSISRTWPVAVSRALLARAGGKSRRADVDLHDEDSDVASGTGAEDDGEVSGFDVDSPTPAARGKSRAAELRAQRQRGAKAASQRAAAAAATPAEAAEDDGLIDSGASTPAEGATTDADEKKKHKPGLGKAGGARRRKMAMKK